MELCRDKPIAIAFAKTEFDNGTVFWPRLLVNYAEHRADGAALGFTIRAYTLVAEERQCGLWIEWLRELQTYLERLPIAAPGTLNERSRQIWDDNRDRSREKRGISRLFWAAGLWEERDKDGYEVEVSRALSLLAWADAGNDMRPRFDELMRQFDEAFS